jgi:hypothetical protein
LIDANSILELRTKPARLTARIAEFVEDSWSADGAGATPRAASA